MTDATADAPEEPAKSGKKPLMIGLVLAVAGAAAGYFGVTMGLIPIGQAAAPAGEHAKADHADGAHDDSPGDLPDVAFVALEPIILSLSESGTIRHLRFRAQLEVEAAYEQDVAAILPRVTDVLNSYLRAIDPADLGDSLALTRLRAQMLRRIQIATGKGRVRDLLIMDFVLN